MEELRKYEISDSTIEHNDWKFPDNIKTRPLRPLAEEEFLINHKIDRSYDDSTTKLKLLVGNATGANIKRAELDTGRLPFDPEIVQSITKQKWISDEYLHLWNRDEGGSASLKSGPFLTFILQTPRDQKAFCSLSLVNREKYYCAGLYIADESYSVHSLLASQSYDNRQLRAPRDFSILPFNILKKHISQTLTHTQDLSRTIVSTEKRISEGKIKLEDNADFKLLNRLNLEHGRLQRRSQFEIELGTNLLKYLDSYQALWQSLWEGATDFIDDMKDKVEQQLRYSDQVRKDLEMMPRRIDNQSKAMSNYIIREDNRLNIEIAKSSQKIAEQARTDNMLNLRLAKATARVAEETRQDSSAMKTLALVTLTFLPATAVASIFSMEGMFNWSPTPDQPQLASPYLYVYFVVTIPVTLIVYVAWVWWTNHKEKQYKEQSVDLELDEIEKTIKSRMRTMTFSLDNFSIDE